MFLHIDPADGVPIYAQVVRQVKYAVAGSAFKKGDLVPSVRELARELAINPNTVARAYRELQADGVLRAVRGTGMEVTEGAVRRCRRERVDLIRARLRRVLAEAGQSGLDAESLQRLWKEEMEELEATEVRP